MRKSRTTIVCQAAWAAALACAAGGCAAPRATLTIATDAAAPPLHMRDAAGAATGYDVELARRVARSAGFEPVVVILPYEELLTSLDDGRADLVAATIGVTPERERSYLFSAPYFETCQAVLVRRGPGEPGRLADLRGRSVAAAPGGTSERAARGIAGAEFHAISKGSNGVAELTTGRADACVNDEFAAVAAARARPEALAVLAEPAAQESYAFVMPRGRLELKRRIDAAIADALRSGAAAELRRRFGVVRDADWPVRLFGRREE